MKMIDYQEEDFPRGGYLPRASTKRSKQEDNLFATVVKKKSKKPRKEKFVNETISDEYFHASLKIQGTLSYSSIKTDMIVLGCVRKVTNISIQVELPGLTFGYISAVNISHPFTTYLKTAIKENSEEYDMLLSRIFKVGQFVLTRIINVENTPKGKHVECTLNPKEIYSGKLRSSFEKGFLVWVSVQSEDEHGYEMNSGVKNCRVFLPNKDIEKGRQLFVGEPLWCIINKCDHFTEASTLRVSCKNDQIRRSKIEEITSLYDLIPGMQVEMLIEKVTNNGVQGKFLNDYFGHIDEGQLNKKLSEYQEGRLMTASVLFTDHTVKVTYLTTFHLDLVTSPDYNKTDIVIGEVISKTHNGIYLKFPSKEKCFVSNKRLLDSLPKKNANLDIFDSIKVKFAIGSRHTCRILDYNYLSKMYIGTVEQALIKEKLFTSSDVQLGQLLDVTVVTIKSDGLVVQAGRLKGFVPNLYLSNVEYSDTIKKKFKEGIKLEARVLNIKDGNLYFTLKPGQVDCEHCLTDLSQAKRGARYPGVIVNTKSDGALVVFYGNVKGWIKKKYLDEQDDDQKPDPEKFFYRGQVVNPWILAVYPDKVLLSIRQPKDFDTFGSLSVGQKINGVISTIRKDKLFINTLKGRSIGVIPVNHLSESITLCPTLFKTFKVGDIINNLICVSNTAGQNVLSRREASAIQRTRLKIKRFSKLKPGNIIRCSFLSSCDSGIYVLPLIIDFTEEVLIDTEDFSSDGSIIPQFVPSQSIVAKVLEVDTESKKIRLTAKLNQVFDNSVENVLGLFSQHIADLQIITKFGKENAWDLCMYAPGERIMCHVEALGDEGGCLVSLPNKVKGLVAPKLCPDKLKKGDKIRGVFLSQNFSENYAEICLKADICQKINTVQDGAINCSNLSSCVMDLVIVKIDMIIAVTREKDGNRQLVYIPLFVHENDFQGCRQFYLQTKLKLCICGKVNDSLIGMSKKLFVTLDNNKKKTKKSQVSPMTKLVTSATRFESPDITSESIDEKNEQTETDEESVLTTEEIAEEHDEEIETDEESASAKPIQSSDFNETSDNEDTFSGSDENDEINDKTLTAKFGRNAPVDSVVKPFPVVSGVNRFFDSDTVTLKENSTDDEIQGSIVKRKKKLSAAERSQLAKEEEERISRIEKELADPSRVPESAEQYDRLLLANPNSSELWTKYIAFHAAATEFDKAKAVAKKALETINPTLVDEKFNIWIALLNLENMWGTKDSFEQTFNEAVKFNDSLRIYLKTIRMLAESRKLNEMEDTIKQAKRKFKQDHRMWLDIAEVYYRLGKFEDARNLNVAAMKSINIKSIQYKIVLRFAILEYTLGEEDHGATIFEEMLNSAPNNVSLWGTYIDQLIKKKRFDEARQVFERAVSQHIPSRKMESLFMKYRKFEEQHGTVETVEHVNEKAEEYLFSIKRKLIDQ